MANSYGNWNQTKRNTLAKGTSHDAAQRVYEKIFNLATDADPAGGTTNVLVGGRVREGSKVTHFTLTSTANLSAINFTVGTAAAPAKYAAATAGPNNGTVVIHVLPTAADDDALTLPEDIIFTPSGALPGAGTIVARAFASHR